MSTVLDGPIGPSTRIAPALDSADLSSRVRDLLRGLTPQSGVAERRGEVRYPYPYLVRLTPVEPDGLTPDGPSVVVVGRHLSLQGLGFYHPQPLAERWMIATLTASGSPQSFLLRLDWCRFTGQGWYESGGRFLRGVDPPDDL